MGLGGSGGTGAAAGDVSVSNLKTTDPNSGKIITEGNYSYGIMAMSIGGGGGSGSTTVTLNRTSTTTESTTANSIALSLGGQGGDGGTGGTVDVVNGGSITTYGYKAHGIVAHSIGVGRQWRVAISGDLGLALEPADAEEKTVQLSFGGSGGNGNRSSDVTVTNSGTIEVYGDSAYGIYAQSVGGGGGDGGTSVSVTNILKNPKTDLASSLTNFSMGGFGGNGADSGDVLVKNTGTILCHGNNSYGIFAQSVSGGGGNASYSLSSPVWMAADLIVSSLLGGGSNGTAGTATVNTTGNITMYGDNSQAFFAQSVNGGGGNIQSLLDISQQAAEIADDGVTKEEHGAVAWVNSKIDIGASWVDKIEGKAISATHIGDLKTFGKDDIASFIQSIGGGGGNSENEIVVDSNAHVDLELALGAKNSSRNSGGNVNVNRTGDIETISDQSAGSFVQSIGGGGGNLTVNVSQIAASSNQTVSATVAKAQSEDLGAPAPAIKGSVNIGADSSTINNGGNLTLNYKGEVVTTGARSYGLMAQSIGGGGGSSIWQDSIVFDVAMGGTKGSSGTGGNITLVNTGDVSTSGVLSHGIIAQSIGGGGGAVFTDLDPANIKVTLHSANSGNGGNISITQTGDVNVSGDRSIGVLAQSLGGGGGLVDGIFMDTAGGAGSGRQSEL